MVAELRTRTFDNLIMAWQMTGAYFAINAEFSKSESLVSAPIFSSPLGSALI